MRLRPSLIALCLLCAASPAYADGRPAVLQAEALLAEQAGDHAKALALLREAYATAPGDGDIAFDLAHIALQHPDLAEPADYDNYIALEATTADQHVLRAYALATRDRLDEAREEARRALAMAPDNAEASSLLDALSETPDPVGQQSAWALRAKLFGQYDTNVSVLPDQSTSPGSGVGSSAIVDASALQRKAAGIGAEAEVRWTPVRGVTELSVAAGASFLGHITGRNEDEVSLSDGAGGTTSTTREGSSTYDYGTFDLSARARFTGERWLTTIELAGSTVFIDDYNERFLTEGDLIASTGYAVGSAKAVRLGAYGIGAARSFGGSFRDQRDGTRFEGGLTVDWQALRSLGFGVRGGYQTEQTTLDIFTESGATGMLYGQARFGRFGALAALTYQHRDYATNIGRVDNRLGPQVTLTYAVTDTFSVVGSYLFIHNSSSLADVDAAAYDYNRHLVSLGLEARF